MTAGTTVSGPDSALTVLRRRLRLAWAVIQVDVRELDALPGRRWAPMGAVAAVAIVFALFRLGIKDLFTESMLFLALALGLGLLSRTTGMLLVLATAVLDLATMPQKPQFWSHAVGRLIAYWVLWVLVVHIPAVQRTVHGAVRLLRPPALRLAAAPLSALVTGALVYLWSTAAPYLIRPVWTGVYWIPTRFTSSPSLAAMAPQRYGQVLALVAVALGLAVAYSYQRRASLGLDHLPDPPAATPGWLALAMRLVRGALMLVAVSGLISSPLDVVLLLGALVGGELLAGALARAPALRNLLARTPYLLRLLVAFGGTFLLSMLVLRIWYKPLGRSAFFPMVVGLGVGLVLYRVLLEVQSGPGGARTPAGGPASAGAQQPTGAPGGAGTGLLAALLAAGLLLTWPGVAYADNCSGLSDCESSLLSRVGAAISATVAFLWGWITGVFEKTPPVIGQLEPLASPEGAEAQWGAMEMLKDLVAKNVLRDTGDVEEYSRIKNMPMSEFANEAMSGKWDNYGASSGGGLSVSGGRGG